MAPDAHRRGRAGGRRRMLPGRLGRLVGAGAGAPTSQSLLLGGTVAALTLLGLLMTLSASFVQSIAESGGPFSIFLRQLLWSAVGLPVLVLLALSDYRVWRPWAAPLLVLSLAAAALVLVPDVGVKAYGARRWLVAGPVSFQPSELLKLTVPLYLAHVMARRWWRLRRGDLHALLLPAVPVIGVAAALVVAEPDLETAMLVAFAGGLVLFAAGLPVRIIATGLGTAVVLATLSIMSTPYRRARFTAWLNPAEHADTFGYQTLQGFIALGSGGWLGVGLGESRGKWLYVPNAHTDFIYAIIGEELGVVGTLAVLVLFAALAVGGVRAARRAPDPFGRLLATAITGWLLLQAGMNMGSVVGLIPVTGVTLPLVSVGGSSLVVTMAALGLLLSIARAGRDDADSRLSPGGRRASA
ncbi:MAG: putative lipid II flippase FtsW [Actinobacteria bacterium]|nr:putative lipid II flippase FtsW [Actinomycetota bacterium]